MQQHSDVGTQKDLVLYRIDNEKGAMKYALMHKNVPVMDFEIDEITGSIRKSSTLYNAEHLPVSVSCKKNIVDRAALNEWWTDRSIPASRLGVKEAMEMLNLTDTRLLVTRCYGLSLSDQYWIKPVNTSIEWKDINFFDNSFSENIGDVLIGKQKKELNFDFISPDNTSDGFLKKRWKIIDGKRCLLKSGSAPFIQQPFNEVIASIIMRALNINHVEYHLIWDDGTPYSVCEDFITSDTELISAWRVIKTAKKENNISVYQHYVDCCQKLGIKDIQHKLDEMIVVDYLIANEDRHMNNFGLIRNAETLEWLGTAPIFDSGSSLGYDKLAGQIISGKNITCKPFKKTHEAQLQLVTSMSWIDFEKLKSCDDKIREVLLQGEEFIDDKRREAIIGSIRKRIDNLEKMSENIGVIADDIENDVDRNIAEDYR